MKYIAILILFVFQLSAETAYLLPHRWHDARHEINMLIRHTDTLLIIVTDSLTDSHLQRALRSAAKADHPVLLMTVSERTASQWAMYRSVSTCMLSQTRALGFSIVAAEGAHACFVSGPLDTDSFRNSYGMLLCDDTSLFSQTLQLLHQECQSYFKATSR